PVSQPIFETPIEPQQAQQPVPHPQPPQHIEEAPQAMVAAPVEQAAQEEMIEEEAEEDNMLPKDKLLAKARAYREKQMQEAAAAAGGGSVTSSEAKRFEQMNFEELERNPIEKARQMAKGISSPFDKNLDVPAFMRRQNRDLE